MSPEVQSRVPVAIYYRPQTKLREGNVFTGVCDSVHTGDAWSGGGLVPGVVPGPGECLVPGGGCLMEAPRTATAADGTHPTGMHSCFQKSLCWQVKRNFPYAYLYFGNKEVLSNFNREECNCVLQSRKTFDAHNLRNRLHCYEMACKYMHLVSFNLSPQIGFQIAMQPLFDCSVTANEFVHCKPEFTSDCLDEWFLLQDFNQASLTKTVSLAIQRLVSTHSNCNPFLGEGYSWEIKAQSAKIFLNFNFLGWGAGGVFLGSQNSKCQDLPKFQFWGDGGILGKV